MEKEKQDYDQKRDEAEIFLKEISKMSTREKRETLAFMVGINFKKDEPVA